MDYFVKRGEDQFGPYSLAELQEYSRVGRILPSDLAKSEGLSEWVPVSQILGNIPVPVAAPVVTATVPVETVPLPPNIHWALFLVIIIICNFLSILGTLFIWIWSMVIGNWARRLNGSNAALILAAVFPVSAFCGGIAIGLGKTSGNSAFPAIGGLLILSGVIMIYVAIFKIRAAMEEYYNSKENMALTLNPVMTFFFGFIYLQYHINRIARWKQTGILS